MLRRYCSYLLTIFSSLDHRWCLWSWFVSQYLEHWKWNWPWIQTGLASLGLLFGTVDLSSCLKLLWILVTYYFDSRGWNDLLTVNLVQVVVYLLLLAYCQAILMLVFLLYDQLIIILINQQTALLAHYLLFLSDLWLITWASLLELATALSVSILKHSPIAQLML